MKQLILAVVTLVTVSVTYAQPITKTPAYTNGQRIEEILTYIEKLYVDDVEDTKLMDAAITAMLEKLDPHSVYISKEEVDDANQRIEGSFVGIGIRFQILKDTLIVVETIAGGPSQKLGIRAGDKIVSIEGLNIAGIGLKNTQVREKLMGDLGTKVRVDIMRKGTKKAQNYVITRDRIPVNSVDCSYIVAPGIGYIKLNSFSRSSHEEITKSIKQLKSEGMENLILDLQSNGGGLLNQAQLLGDEFLSEDKLIVYSEGRAYPRQDLKANPKTVGTWEKGRLIVLTDENSASASEILAGSIQDWDRGLIVGRRSYGKGLVQRPIDLTDGSQMRLTIARYFTPSGRFIQKSYEDLDAYRNDYMTRFMNGEMSHLDSIKLPDSLKFETKLTKRAVYGGGGIMPDVFVPIDTSEITDVYRDAASTGAFNSFSLTYVEDHRDELNKKYENLDDFIKGFNCDKAVMDAFFEHVKKEDPEFKFVEEQYKTSSSIMTLRLKANIAQDLFGTEAFYEIYNVKNEILQKAIELLQNNSYDDMNLAKTK